MVVFSTLEAAMTQLENALPSEPAQGVGLASLGWDGTPMMAFLGEDSLPSNGLPMHAVTLLCLWCILFVLIRQGLGEYILFSAGYTVYWTSYAVA